MTFLVQLSKYWRVTMNQAFNALSTSTSGQHETVHVCRTAYTLRPFPPLYHASILSHFNFSGTCCSKCGGERMQWRKDRVNSLEGNKGTNTETITVHVHTQSRRQELVLHTSEVRLVRGALKPVTTSPNSLPCTDGSIRSILHHNDYVLETCTTRTSTLSSIQLSSPAPSWFWTPFLPMRIQGMYFSSTGAACSTQWQSADSCVRYPT